MAHSITALISDPEVGVSSIRNICGEIITITEGILVKIMINIEGLGDGECCNGGLVTRPRQVRRYSECHTRKLQ